MNRDYFWAFAILLILTSVTTSAQEINPNSSLQDVNIALPDQPFRYFFSTTLRENVNLFFATGEKDLELRLRYADKRSREYELLAEKGGDEKLLEDLEKRRVQIVSRAKEIAEERGLSDFELMIEEHEKTAGEVKDKVSLVIKLRNSDNEEEKEEIGRRIDEMNENIQERREERREEIQENISEEIEEFQEESEERAEEREERREEIVDSIKDAINNSESQDDFETIALNGRIFYLEKPEDIDLENVPVIIALHGRNQNAEAWFKDMNSQGAFTSEALARGYAIIAPDSVEPICEGVKQWDYSADSGDLQFIQDIFSYIDEQENLDENRIFVVGISNGAFMTSRVGMTMGNEKIRALVVHSGGNAYAGTTDSENECITDFNYENNFVSSNHPPTWVVHGTADIIVPYDSGESYYNSLVSSGIEARLITKRFGIHNWFDEYDKEILDWFESFD